MSYFFQHGGVDWPNKSRNSIIGGWKELGRASLSGGVYDVSSLADKRYYMILGDLQLNAGGTAPIDMRINNLSTGTYATRDSVNGGADSTATSATGIQHGNFNQTASSDILLVGYWSNKSANEKLYQGCSTGIQAAGAGTAPNRQEVVGKNSLTSGVIDRFQISDYSGGGGDYDAGELVVLGWDPTGTHTTNFWTELASINASGASTNLSSGTITAKKYLWVQAWLKNTTSHTTGMTFNNDTTTYSYRLSDNGGADSTQVTQADISLYSAVTTPIFVNMFIINNSATEKLVIGHTISQSTAGAGTAPNRREFVGKYDSTAAQITEIDIDSSSGNWDATSIIKVWGSD